MGDTVLAEQPRYPTEKCDACPALIIWAVTDRANRMPVDAEPVDTNAGGGDVLLSMVGGQVRARVTKNPADLFGKTVFRRHMQTCTHADYYRGKRRRSHG